MLYSGSNKCGVPADLCDGSRGDSTMNTSSSTAPHLTDEVAIKQLDNENDGCGNKYVCLV